jgi:5-methylcytosine-specific restriction endonuclease McrA
VAKSPLPELPPGSPPTSKYIPAKVRKAVYERDQYACFYCGKKRSEGAVLNLDHFIARALGGTNEIDNLFTACRECNNRKGRTGPGDIIRRMSAGIRKFGV